MIHASGDSLGIHQPRSISRGRAARDRAIGLAVTRFNLSGGRKAATGNGRGLGGALRDRCRIAPGNQTPSRSAEPSECITPAETSFRRSGSRAAVYKPTAYQPHHEGAGTSLRRVG